MVITLFNTLSRKKEEFIPIVEKNVRMYSCGPTVYGYAHIGNFRAFVFADILKRYLLYKGFNVTHIMNITDVDDKTIRDSKSAGKTLTEFTEFYEGAFLEDLEILNIKKADSMPKATDHIDDMVKMIETLKEKGFAYEKDGSVYFKISSDEHYGKLALLDRQTLQNNADGRLDDEYEKDDARDFALWKSYDPSDGDVFWETSLGKGRPGWHIECSAMSTHYLGESFDIHTGGVDLIFPHHTNEIAQSECSLGKEFVKYWLHNEHLIVNGEKMSKSLGNFFTLRDLLNKKYDPIAIRYELLSTHYRQKLDFREDQLKGVIQTLLRFKELFVKLDHSNGNSNQKVDELILGLEKDFETAMDDDLNIAGALSCLFVFIREIHKLLEFSSEDATRIKNSLLKIDSVLGIMNYTSEEIPDDIKELAEKRLVARKESNWSESDKLRADIHSKGYQVDDVKEGYILKKI